MKILNRSEIAQQFDEEWNRSEIAQQCDEEAPPSAAPHYNVKIKSIIKDDKIYDESEHYTLKPQEIVLIITEKISLKSSQIGFLHSKQRRYREGLWIVEPAMVHPGYVGHLQVHVVNMSNLGISLKAGSKILELIVFENETNFGDFPDPEKSYNEVERISLEEEQRTPKTFLNIKGNEEEILSTMFPKWLKSVSWTVGITVAIVALVTAGLSFFSYFNVNRLISESYDLEKIDLSREVDKLNARIQRLESQNK